MKKIYILILAAVILVTFYVVAPSQMSDTCTDGQVVVLDVTNKRHKCLSLSLPLIYRSKSVNLNSGVNTDVATITGLPARYIIRRVTFDGASATPTLATISVYTGAGATGTAVVTAQALSTMNATTVYLDATLGVAGLVLTSSTLTIRNVAVAGSAMTVDVTVEVEPLA